MRPIQLPSLGLSSKWSKSMARKENKQILLMKLTVLRYIFDVWQTINQSENLFHLSIIKGDYNCSLQI